MLIALIIVGVLVAVAWWINGTHPVTQGQSEEQIFVIPKGTTIRQIGNNLKENGLIRDPVVFFLKIKQKGIDRDIQAGSYKLSPSMNLESIITELQTGRIDVWLTFPEGIRTEQMAEIIKENVPTYEDSWEDALKAEEGYLYPDTYLIPTDATIEIILNVLRQNFNEKLESAQITQTGEDLERIIIIASLIERESKLEEDQPIVASVIANRLEIGMPLQIDASVQYALGYSEEEQTWWRIPLPEHLEVDSAYNTYKNPGLPPAPIANPGITAIQAAANPQDTDYIYYVNDDTGKLHFAQTLEEHNENIEKYLN